ncbi:helix-turn-helix transcriptional regulator [Rummeliibacillus pycnus]|uniref:helix-turn-helix transcriptional regulator n=1 Tax=Rummeliibacillus pycnus TaxID=101070 RepID=UPI003D27FD7E
MRNWLKQERIKQGLTQEKIAVASEISRAYYNMIERGNRTPLPDIAIKIANNLSIDWTNFYK